MTAILSKRIFTVFSDSLISLPAVLFQFGVLDPPVQRGPPGEGGHSDPQSALPRLGRDLC